MKVSVKAAFRQLVEHEMEDIKRDVRLDLKMRETEKPNQGQVSATGEPTLRNATRSGLKRELARRRTNYERMEREDTPPKREDRRERRSRSADKKAKKGKKGEGKRGKNKDRDRSEKNDREHKGDKGAEDSKKLWKMWNELSDKNKDNVCRFYSVGKCNRGDKCKFDHTCAICGGNHSMKDCKKKKR